MLQKTLVSFLASVTLILGFTTTPATAYDLSLQTLWTQTFVGKSFKLDRKVSSNSAYDRYQVSYRSNGLKITGVMNIPKGRGPFPVAILAHGYIDPDIYVTGQGMAREQDYLARRGIVAFHVDYRNHAGSDNDPNFMKKLRYGYTEDVINAALAIKASSNPKFNKNQLSLFGRSMGGAVAYNALISRPGLFDSAVVWASVSTLAWENVQKWMANDPDVKKYVIGKYGDNKENPSFWRGMSPLSYFDRITDPILVEHGSADTTCPVKWADKAVKRLKANGKTVKYAKRAGAGHTFYDSTFNSAIADTVNFMKRNFS
jgi:dipeptidyl aminopeptidase/acylaminoacyl peptidase